jgi:RNA polymerase sigma-70 factor (ECF subfamily)
MSEFHRLIEQQIPRLRRYARALTFNRERADDLVQDTLARALVKEHLWQPGTDLRAWLFTIMHNQNVNTVRQGVREAAAVDVEAVSATLIATTDPSASRQLRELERALSRLPLGQRQVILLVGLEGMSYEDAAAILRIPIGTVRSRLSRGRNMLRELLDMNEERCSPFPVARDSTTAYMEGFIPPSVLSWNDKDGNCLLSDRPGRWMAFRRKLTAPLTSGMGQGRRSRAAVRGSALPQKAAQPLLQSIISSVPIADISRTSPGAGPGTRRSAGRYSRPYRRPLSRTLRRQIAYSAGTNSLSRTSPV